MRWCTYSTQNARPGSAHCVDLSGVRLHAPIPVPPAVRDFMAFEEHVVTLAVEHIGRITARVMA